MAPKHRPQGKQQEQQSNVPSVERPNTRKRSREEAEESSTDGLPIERPPKAKKSNNPQSRPRNDSVSNVQAQPSTSEPATRSQVGQQATGQPKPRTYKRYPSMTRGVALLRRLGFFHTEGRCDHVETIKNEIIAAGDGEPEEGETLVRRDSRINNAVRKEVSKSASEYIGKGSKEAKEFQEWRCAPKNKGSEALRGSLIGKEGTGTTPRDARQASSNSHQGRRTRTQAEPELVEEHVADGGIGGVVEEGEEQEEEGSEDVEADDDEEVAEARSNPTSVYDNELRESQEARQEEEPEDGDELERQEFTAETALLPSDLITSPLDIYEEDLEQAELTEEELAISFPDLFPAPQSEQDGGFQQFSDYSDGNLDSEPIYLLEREKKSLLTIDWREISPVFLEP